MRDATFASVAGHDTLGLTTGHTEVVPWRESSRSRGVPCVDIAVAPRLFLLLFFCAAFRARDATFASVTGHGTLALTTGHMEVVPWRQSSRSGRIFVLLFVTACFCLGC
jgi:hypothetical protein